MPPVPPLDPADRPTLRRNVAASAAEAREFVASLRGRRPAEAMGVVARSHLMRATLQSAGILCAFILLFTLPQYFFGGGSRAPARAPGAAATATAPGPAPASGPATRAATRPAGRTVPEGILRQDVPRPGERRHDADDLLDTLK